MKKIIITTMFLIVAFVNTYAQNKINIFAAGNLGLSKVNFSPSNNIKIASAVSVGIGAHVTYSLLKNINIVAMPTFQTKGYGYSNYSTAEFFDVKLKYLEMPVLVEFGFGAKALFGQLLGDGEKKPFFFGAGLYAGVAVGGKYIDKNVVGDPVTKIKFGESLTDNRSRIDYGLHFTLGSTFDKFKVGILKQVGLKNAVPSARQNQGLSSNKNANFSVFMAYNISNLFKKK